jgi:hypothetical protein
MKILQLVAVLLLSCASFPSVAQNIFSEKGMDYKKPLLPYDLPYAIALEDKHFVTLQEQKKNNLKLGRYDQYFFEQWEQTIEFDEKESVPQMYVKNDTVCTYSFTALKDKNLIGVTFRFFDIKSGSELGKNNYEMPFTWNDRFLPRITFSPNRSKFVVHDFFGYGSDAGMVQFHVFSTGEEVALKKYTLPGEMFIKDITCNLHLDNNGDLFLAIVNPIDYKVQTVFWNSINEEKSQVESNFFLQRPPDKIGKIEIIRQGASSYLIAFAAQIEDELIGFSLLGINVILKTVMITHHQNFTVDEINELYADYFLTAEKQKKKRLQTPVKLNNFRLIKSMINSSNDVILVFEELGIPVPYHQSLRGGVMPWKPKINEDKYYFGGDILLYCFTETGQFKWKKTIQKTQFSQAVSHGLSAISRMENDQMGLLCSENSKGGNFYILSINTADGSLIKKVNLLPDKKYDFVKKYSCWLDGSSVVICGAKPSNSSRRTLMLVEF